MWYSTVHDLAPIADDGAATRACKSSAIRAHRSVYMEIPGAEQPDQAGDDQINRGDVIQQPWYDEYQYAGDEGDDRREAQCHVQG